MTDVVCTLRSPSHDLLRCVHDKTDTQVDTSAGGAVSENASPVTDYGEIRQERQAGGGTGKGYFSVLGPAG